MSSSNSRGSGAGSATFRLAIARTRSLSVGHGCELDVRAATVHRSALSAALRIAAARRRAAELREAIGDASIAALGARITAEHASA